ncbi:acetyl-CoA carboxylase biotin carboxylase subunit [Capillimicrobium parvum]|uniref:biotin carboxylase n=1 Tax=Capillimicrobium parvum TaxID=2884022 RepID=A0A9E6XWS5_9ACTN|nr:acetyl-CoA carboxylase biotin carboxylase subunit [Capillimicrobium parvum]UGS35951.1 Biotin carboxylase [Capillimicrobium parvum]
MTLPELRRVLVANRGEIAVRVIRACADLGIESVAVYSDADASALHVQLADEARAIGPPPARKSYLRADAIVEAALAANADAVHPGYGFLAEVPALPRACAEAGLRFVGPPAHVMELVGDKVAARAAASRAGVPIVPGSDRAEDADAAHAFAGEVGYPVMLKASAGGGGRGIRVVAAPDEMRAAFSGAFAQAEAAFGDGALFVEKLVERARHVEVQVLADELGSVVHLFERECSIQRHRQKLVEEAPSPGISEQLRQDLCASAVALAHEVGYVNAGTVEFLVDVDAQAFYFLEVNARIQVEHGVTELVTGVDLVAEQLRIAAGEPLSFMQDDVRRYGTAIEFRINAEDPDNGFMPSPGRIEALRLPAGPGVRVDTGVEAGDAVQPFYDSMIAKLMVWGRDRDEALARARRALDELVVDGVTTTRGLHRRLLEWEGLAEATADTGALEALLSADAPS